MTIVLYLNNNEPMLQLNRHQAYTSDDSQGPHVRASALKKAAVHLQIMAIVLLQLYTVAPLLSRNFAVQAGVMTCSGDHTKCGCSSARIASRTCCCFQSKQLIKASSSATEAADGETSVTHEDHAGSAGTEPRAKDRQGRTGQTICAAPCGGDPAVITTSLDNAKFLCSSVLLTDHASFTTEYQHPRSTLFQSRFPEPPDPPPRLFMLA